MNTQTKPRNTILGAVAVAGVGGGGGGRWRGSVAGVSDVYREKRLLLIVLWGGTDVVHVVSFIRTRTALRMRDV